jgi:hypothetical protein
LPSGSCESSRKEAEERSFVAVLQIMSDTGSTNTKPKAKGKTKAKAKGKLKAKPGGEVSASQQLVEDEADAVQGDDGEAPPADGGEEKPSAEANEQAPVAEEKPEDILEDPKTDQKPLDQKSQNANIDEETVGLKENREDQTDGLKENREDLGFTEKPDHGKGYWAGVTLLLLLCIAATAGSSVAVWTQIGCGDDCLKHLQTDTALMASYGVISVACIIASLLYLFDFYWPPRTYIKAGYFRFTPPGKPDTLGKSILMVIGLLCVCGGYLLAKDYACFPMVLTTYACPFLIAAVKPLVAPTMVMDDELMVNVNLEAQIKMLEKLTKHEAGDQYGFYSSVAIAMFISALAVLITFCAWFFPDTDQFQSSDDRAANNKALLLFIGPLLISLTLFGFAALALGRCMLIYTGEREIEEKKEGLSLRNMISRLSNALQTTHGTADPLKNKIKARLTENPAQAVKSIRTTQEKAAFAELTECQQDELIDFHAKYMQQLTFILKTAGVAFGLVLAVLVVIYQLAVEHGSFVFAIKMFVLTYVFVAIVCMSASFTSLVNAMSRTVLEMPLFKGILSIGSHDGFRALMVLCVGPLSPALYLLSAINQRIRVKRGLYTDALVRDDNTGKYKVEFQIAPMSPLQEVEMLNSPEELRVTLRVHLFIERAKCWNWARVLNFCYILTACYAIYYIAPLAIEIILALFIKLLAESELVVIVISVWFLGLFLFLLPPVPGAPVYFFGAILITTKSMAMKMAGSVDSGFWLGSLLSIFVCWVLKLSACAMQQKGIGGMLGTQLWVKQTCGVHTPTIRAIEYVLSQPGLSFGKVMILCGGPDWPTSVLAGLLGLSLWSCEIGTTPIIFYIAPFSLSGSFLLRSNESEIWANSSNLMLYITFLMTLVYWAACAWVIQATFTERNEELTKKLYKNIDLDWLDYKAEHIQKKVTENTKITLGDAPTPVKVAYISGAVLMVICYQGFNWGSSYMFGTFKMTTHRVEDIKWLPSDGDDALIKWPAVIVTGLLIVGFFGRTIFNKWVKSVTSQVRAEATKEADEMEATWKAEQRELLKATKPEGMDEDSAAIPQVTPDPEASPSQEKQEPPEQNANPESQPPSDPQAPKDENPETEVPPQSEPQPEVPPPGEPVEPQVIGKPDAGETATEAA